MDFAPHQHDFFAFSIDEDQQVLPIRVGPLSLAPIVITGHDVRMRDSIDAKYAICVRRPQQLRDWQLAALPAKRPGNKVPRLIATTFADVPSVLGQ